jgi:hypothetical protein
MFSRVHFLCCVLADLLVVIVAPLANAQSTSTPTQASTSGTTAPATSAATSASTTAASKAQQAIDQAADAGKYTFLLFYKQNDDATRMMTTVLNQVVASKSEQAVMASAQVGLPAEQALVTKYDVSRAPMPMTVVIAPNGAMTGIFSQKVSAAALNEAFVTPTMMVTMKSLQAGKLVLVTVQGSAKGAAPAALKDFQSDPHFKDRLVTISMEAADPLETKFLGQMQLDPKTKSTHTVLLAPPGVLVGKFDAIASKDEIAAALAKAGKCCDDPNCKHHQAAPPSTNAAPRTATRR